MGIKVIQRLVFVNLALVALQAISAGFFLSGYGRAVTIHRVAASALELGAFAQALAAVIQWQRHRLPGRVGGMSVGLFAIMVLQASLGYGQRYWLHIPLGVGLFGGLIRQTAKLDGS